MNLRKFYLFPLFVVLFLAISVSCGPTYGDYDAVSSEPAPEMVRKSAGGAMLASTASVGAADEEANYDVPAESPAAPREERKRIKTGYLEMIVDDTAESTRVIKGRLNAVDGWISAENTDGSWVYLTLRVPAADFDAFIDGMEGLGKVVQRRVDVTDVTDQYVDLEERIRNKTILRDRYRAYLDRSADIEEILQVERALSDVTYEIESLQGSLKSLDRRVVFSTLDLTLRPPIKETVGNTLPDFRSAFARVGGVLADAGYYILFGLLYVLLIGVPGVLLIGLLWWLSFGKVGLIRRLFRRVARRSGEG